MKIQIETRLKPFSHEPASACLLPGTHCKVEAYPTLLQVGDKRFPLQLTGPVENFTLEQDLEKGCVWVFGKAKEGFYRFKIVGEVGRVEIVVDKAPRGGVYVDQKLLKAKEKIVLEMDLPFFLPSQWERLSLGSQKKQDWDGVWKRFDLEEILPVLYGLGQKIPRVEGEVEIRDLKHFCRAGFSKILVPRLIDEEHQGLLFQINPKANPISLILSAKDKIRSLFFQQFDRHLHILPNNPFLAGKFLHIQALDIGELDMEWTKGSLRCMILRAQKSGEIFLDLPKAITQYRIKTKSKEKGIWHKADELLTLQAGKTYFLDRFQK